MRDLMSNAHKQFPIWATDMRLFLYEDSSKPLLAKALVMLRLCASSPELLRVA